MTEVLIKETVKVGNGAGVILPRSWYGGKVRVELVENPLDIKKDVMKILDDYLDKILGVYLVGSYARGEQTERSDVDILVITDRIDKVIKKGKYEIIMVSKENVEKSLKDNILPLLPMLREASTLINRELIKNYINTSLTRKNLSFHIETTKSALKVVRGLIDLSEDLDGASEGILYSLGLRLRETYIVECLIMKKSYSNKEFITLVKKLTGSRKLYDGYLESKDKVKIKNFVSVSEARMVYDYTLKKLKEQEKWIRKRG
ncbi:MAG: nucleotidyltransferase domain-containing protein [Nanoarchaeota archaeon]|nr:nucleotidyltransferase domain-containing protein [Nanoarchaeota archaeon]